MTRHDGTALGRHGAGHAWRALWLVACALALAGCFGGEAPAMPNTSLSGRVTGGPATGLAVILSGPVVITVSVAPDGTYQANGVAPGIYNVIPTADGYQFGPASQSIAVLGTPVTGVDFTALGALGIAGTVQGAALPGIPVHLSGTATADTTTDSAGHYAFDGLSPGPYSVAPGSPVYVYSPASASVTLSRQSLTAVDFASTCDVYAPFQSVVLLAGVGGPGLNASGAGLSADELLIVYLSEQSPAGLWMADRASLDQPFTHARPLASPAMPASGMYEAALSADGLSIYYNSAAGDQIYFATRPSRSADFGAGVRLPGLTGVANYSESAYPMAGSLYFSLSPDGASEWQLAVAPWTGPNAVGAVQLFPETHEPGAWDEAAVLSADELTLYFASWRTGNVGLNDIWVTHRASRDAPFAAPVNVAELNSITRDLPDYLSQDSCRLYLESNRGEPVYGLGPRQLYVADRRR